MTPLITFLMLYRGRYETDQSLRNLFVSLEEKLPKNTFEVIVRLDDDDLYGKGTFKQLIHEFSKLNIKYYIHHRWEGRWSINYDYLYLFTHKHPETRWVGFLTDDCFFTRNIIDDLHTDKYIVGDFQSPMTEEKMTCIDDYKKETWLTPEYICAYPLVCSHLIKIMCNMGYQVNIDSTLALLNAICYKKYNMILAKHIPEFIIRNNVDRADNWGVNFNKSILITDTDIPSTDDFFFGLMEQQAKNIYLNITKG